MGPTASPLVPTPAAERPPHPFARLRWVALAWLAAWVPAYAAVWGWKNFLALCDIAVIVTCIGLWRASPLLLSSQALSSLIVDTLWTIDVAIRALTGRHVLGGTEYMWNAQFPLGVRLLSLFHVVWPPLLIMALRRVGYDRRAWALQTAIALASVGLARLVDSPVRNLNFAFKVPVLGYQFQPGVLHVVITTAFLAVAFYLPTHLALARWLDRPRGGSR